MTIIQTSNLWMMIKFKGKISWHINHKVKKKFRQVNLHISNEVQLVAKLVHTVELPNQQVIIP